MIEHAIVATLTLALAVLINSRVHWHFHYKIRTVELAITPAKKKEKRGEILDRIPEQRAVPGRPYRSTPERLADRQVELIASALVNLGAEKRAALGAAKETMTTCPAKDFDSQFRFALSAIAKY